MKVDAEGFPITDRVELANRLAGDLRRYADELHPGCEREVNLRVAADIIESLIEEYSEARREVRAEAEWRQDLQRDKLALQNLVDRAIKMMTLAGYGIAPVKRADHNNPIVEWMADARVALEAK